MDNPQNLGACYLCGVSDQEIVSIKVEYSNYICELLGKNDIFLQNLPLHNAVEQISSWNNCFHCLRLISELNLVLTKQGELVEQIKKRIKKETKRKADLVKLAKTKEEEEKYESEPEMESEEFFCKIEVDPDPAADDEEDDNDTFVLQTFDPPPPSPPKEDAISLSPLPPFQFHQPRNKGPPQPQACPICNKVFRGGHPKSRLRLHVDHVHGKVKPFPCPYCDFATTGKNMWVTHLLKKHETLEPSKPLACPHCPITFAISQLYSRHVENHTNLDFPHFCLNCDTRFQGRDQLDHHNRVSCPLLQQAKRIRQPLPCPVCEVTFFTEVKLSTHQRTQHPELLTFICPTCSSSHMAESHLTTHAQLHDDSLESYPCLVCRRVEFKLKDDLSLHLSSTHTGEETVPCDLAGCPIRFSSIATKLQHMGSTHKEAVWKCPTCQEGFTTLSARTTHEERAHKNQGVESFPCEEDGCGKILTSRLSLAGHVSRVHRRTGARMCEICGKQLTTVSSYKDHIKIHSGVKDWICEVCGRGFSCRKILKDHQVTHTGERPFKCKLCDKAYTQRQVLTSHVRKVHGGEGLKT